MESDNNNVTVEQLQAELQKVKLERDEAVQRSQSLHLQNQTLLEVSYPRTGKEKYSSRIMIKKLLKEGKAAVGREIVLCGWAKTIRKQGGTKAPFAFVD